jgi:hypothetical protein
MCGIAGFLSWKSEFGTAGSEEVAQKTTRIKALSNAAAFLARQRDDRDDTSVKDG